MITLIRTLDMRVLEALYAIRDPLVVQTFIWISEFGSGWIIYGLACVIALLLLRKRHVAYASGLCITLTTSGLGVLLLKGLVARARPPQEFQAYQEIWYSFPSAHAALSTALYGFLIFLAWRLITHRVLRYTTTVVLSILVVSVSFSRLYLGLHYVSDVVAGIILGMLALWIGIKWIGYTETR